METNKDNMKPLNQILDDTCKLSGMTKGEVLKEALKAKEVICPKCKGNVKKLYPNIPAYECLTCRFIFVPEGTERPCA